MLFDRLNNHPQIACFGELFRPTKQYVEQGIYRFPGALEHLHDIDPAWLDDDNRFSHPNAYLRAIFALRPGYDFYGFKIHLGQHMNFILDCVRSPIRRVILLRRQNILARWSSTMMAKQTGQGAAVAGERIKQITIDFDQTDFRRLLDRSNKHWQRVHEEVASGGLDCLDVDYVAFSTGGQPELDRVLKHIGAETGHDLPTEFVKRNTSRIIDRFNNPDDVLAELDRIGHPEWVEEGNRRSGANPPDSLITR